jgi:hypothetical protein
LPDDDPDAAVAEPRLLMIADDRSSVAAVESLELTELVEVGAAVAAPWTARNPVSPLAAAMLAIIVARRARAAGWRRPRRRATELPCALDLFGVCSNSRTSSIEHDESVTRTLVPAERNLGIS